jgi:hypothetical protein
MMKENLSWLVRALSCHISHPGGSHAISGLSRRVRRQHHERGRLRSVHLGVALLHNAESVLVSSIVARLATAFTRKRGPEPAGRFLPVV